MCNLHSATLTATLHSNPSVQPDQWTYGHLIWFYGEHLGDEQKVCACSHRGQRQGLFIQSEIAASRVLPTFPCTNLARASPQPQGDREHPMV